MRRKKRALIYNPEIVDQIEHIIATGKKTDVTHMSSAEFKALLLKK